MGNILIKNGRVWDGQQFLFADILTDGPVISRIAPEITCEKAYVYDASGKIVSAGLVDCHMHMTGLSGPEYAICPEAVCFPFGVTAAVDAGARLGDRDTLSHIAVKSLVFAGAVVKDNRVDRFATASRLGRYGEKGLGIKLFFDSTSPQIRDIAPLEEVCGLARELGVKVLVHCNHSPAAMVDIVGTLAPGDILSHVFHGGANNCAEDDFAAFRLAKESGVVMDAAFAGHVHTDFSVLTAAINAGYLPDTISTDITCSSAFKRGGRYGLTMCMSMARTAGMEEADIFRAVTSAPAKALGKAGQWGCLKEGGCADIAVLEYSDESFCLTDKAGNTLQSNTGYRCLLSLSDGQVVYKH